MLKKKCSENGWEFDRYRGSGMNARQAVWVQYYITEKGDNNSMSKDVKRMNESAFGKRKPIK